MVRRVKRSRLVFKKYLEDNQKTLDHFGNKKTDKYVRDRWMMEASPLVDRDEEILGKEADGFI